jgi:hypothetical protein
MVRLERSDKHLRKLQASANKGHEVIETSFRQLGGKPKGARKGDLNQIAASIVEQTISAKNPAAVALGRLGGLKGGKARAQSLSANARAAIPKKAAKARWRKTKR